MAKQATKKPAAKAQPAAKPKQYTLLTLPVEPVVDIVEGEEQLLRLIQERARSMNIPISQIPTCGLFRVFTEEVDLQCSEMKLETKK